MSIEKTMPKLTHASYRQLAAFRYEMRKFLSFSEQAARNAGIEPQQHQVLLAIRGLPSGDRPTIGTVAERLCIQHHTAVGLVDKLEGHGLLERQRGTSDRREVLLRLTPEGEAILRRLSTLHQQQLIVVGPAMVSALSAIVSDAGGTSLPQAPARR
jgi:DNA-binding MarR family transcriptional regulator